jgi:ankyrin repeat protein
MPDTEKIQFDSLLSKKFFKQESVIDEMLPDSPETLKEFLKSRKGKEFKRCCAELIDNLIAWIENHHLPDAIIAIDRLKNFKKICTQYEGEDEAANSDYYDLYQCIPLLALIVNTPMPLDARKELMLDLISDNMATPEAALICIALVYEKLINLNLKISGMLPPLNNNLIKFLGSPKGKEFLNFFASCVDGLIQWSESNLLQGEEKNEIVNNLKRFKEIYTKKTPQEETAARYLRMYREGTYRLMHLAHLMQDGSILLATRQNVIKNMAIRGNLTVCSDGAYSRIDSACNQLLACKDLPAALREIRVAKVRQFVAEAIIGTDRIAAGNEIHYGEYVLNKFADQLGIKVFEDRDVFDDSPCAEELIKRCQGVNGIAKIITVNTVIEGIRINLELEFDTLLNSFNKGDSDANEFEAKLNFYGVDDSISVDGMLHLDDADCDLLLMPSPPKQPDPMDLPGKAALVYIVSPDGFYFMDKRKGRCDRITIDKDKLDMLKKKLLTGDDVNNNAVECLREALPFSSLKKITEITGHAISRTIFSWKASYVQHLSLFKRLCNGEYFDVDKIKKRVEPFKFTRKFLNEPTEFNFEVHYFPDRTLKQAYLPILDYPSKHQSFIPFCVETFYSDEESNRNALIKFLLDNMTHDQILEITEAIGQYLKSDEYKLLEYSDPTDKENQLNNLCDAILHLIRSDKFGNECLIALASLPETVIKRLLNELEKKDIDAQDQDGKTALMHVVALGHTNIVQLLLESGKADVNIQDKDGWTALMHAAYFGHKEVVKLLLDIQEEKEVNTQNQDGDTALILATARGYADIVNLLVNSKKSTNKDIICLLSYPLFDRSRDYLRLTVAAVYGHADIAQQLLNKLTIKDINRKSSSYGLTPFMLAVEYGHKEVVHLFLNKLEKKDVDAQDGDGKTALMHAVEHGHTNIVQLLLESGKVDVNAQDQDGTTALLCAARRGRINIVQLLLESGKADVNTQDQGGKTALMCAAYRGHMNVVQLLLENGADGNIQDKVGWTALMSAAIRGHTNIVQLLLEKGKADINTQDISGVTALMCCCSSWGYMNVVQLLLENGADGNIQHKGGWTALMLAVLNGHANIIKLLSDKKNVDINAKNDIKELGLGQITAFMLAAYLGHTEIVKWFLESRKTDVIAQNENGWTALMYAAKRGHREIVALLLNEIKDVDTKNNLGGTALMFAAGAGHTDIVKLLLEHGADVNAAEKFLSFNTALRFAFLNHHMDIVKLLLESGKVKRSAIETVYRDYEDLVCLLDDYILFRVAIILGKKEIVQKLLTVLEVKDINTENKDGNSPFMLAIAHGHESIVKLLLDNRKVDFNKSNINGWTSLHHAINNDNAEIVNLLLENEELTKEHANQQDVLGKTPLIFAILKGNTQVITQFLNSEKIDVNIPDHNGRTPLHHAIDTGNVEIVKRLLESEKIDLRTPGCNGQTLSQYALDKNNEMINKAFRDQSSKAKLKDYKAEREAKSHDQYLSKFPRLCRLFGGFSKDEKFKAVDALIAFIDQKVDKKSLKDHKKVLSQGDLGKIYRKIKPSLK